MSHPIHRWVPNALRAELITSSVAINTLMLAMPLATLQVYDRVLTHPAGGTLMMLSLGVAVAVVMEAVLRLLRVQVTTGLAQSYERERSARLVAHVLGSWVGGAQSRQSGEYVQALSAIGRLKDYAMQRVIALSVDVPYVGLFLVLLGIIGGMLVVVPILAVAAMTLLVVYWGGSLRRAIAQRNASDEIRYGFLLETMTGIHTIKALGFEPRFIHQFRKLQVDTGRSGLRIALLNHAMVGGGAMFSQIIVVLVITTGAPMVMHGSLSMGGLIACVLLSGRLIQPLQHALMCWMSYQEYAQAADQLGRIENLPLQPFAAHAIPTVREGSVLCARLHFRYREELPWVLQNVDLTLAPGEIVSLSGEGSSGRTTLLKLLVGLLAPTEGAVRIDGEDPTRMLPEILNQHVAYLSAEPVLVRGTILENLTSFDPAQRDRALEVAQLIGLDPLIAQLPSGYDTMLDGGEAEAIPPGMRQRIAVARALRHKPRLIVYDQADRSLDREGYHQLFRLMARLKGKATMVLVTDDQNLMRLCDRKLVLRKGVLHATDAPPRLQLVRQAGAA